MCPSIVDLGLRKIQLLLRCPVPAAAAVSSSLKSKSHFDCTLETQPRTQPPTSPPTTQNRRGMRRGIGVKAVKAKQQNKEAFNALGKEIHDANLQHVTTLMSTFKDSLEEFARKYKKEINASPVFRSEFTKMCAKIGVDPLASNKGFWAQVLGVGDFYYELAVQVIEICLLTRASNGGLMSLQDLLQRLRRRRKLDRISEEDVKTAIQKVHLLGAGFQLLQSGSSVLVVSVPTELSSDHAAILQEAQRAPGEEGEGGCCSVTVAGLREGLRWEERRIRVALDLMMQGVMVWVDEQAGSKGPSYWFPSLWAQARLAASGGGGEEA